MAFLAGGWEGYRGGGRATTLAAGWMKQVRVHSHHPLRKNFLYCLFICSRKIKVKTV